MSGTSGKATEASTLTLGDLLYADQAKHRVAEEDWQGLLKAVPSGSRPALHMLFERTNRIVYTLLVRITGDRRVAEALTVDVFHDVWRRAGDYRTSGGTVVGWIMNHARSRGLAHRGTSARNPATAPEALRLQAVLQTLQPAERQAIEEAFFNERTLAEIALQLNLTEDAVKRHIAAGLAGLQHATDNDGAGS